MSAIQHLINSCEAGTPLSHDALSMIPLLSSSLTALAKDYFVLDEAISTGQFIVTEVSDDGSVPHLLAVNELGARVFLLDGEHLVGAKQDRVLNLSIMLPPRSRTPINVSCVEAGRWNRRSEHFASASRAQFAEGRRRKMASVSASLEERGEAYSDQGELWEAISAKAHRMESRSPTMAMSALFESSEDRLLGFLQALPSHPRQIGAVFLIGDRIAGVELFDTPETWSQLSGRIIKSYALDALEHRGPAAPHAFDVKAFLADALSAAAKRYPGTGLGETVRLTAPRLTGAALEVDGRCIHLAVLAH